MTSSNSLIKLKLRGFIGDASIGEIELCHEVRSNLAIDLVETIEQYAMMKVIKANNLERGMLENLPISNYFVEGMEISAVFQPFRFKWGNLRIADNTRLTFLALHYVMVCYEIFTYLCDDIDLPDYGVPLLNSISYQTGSHTLKLQVKEI